MQCFHARNFGERALNNRIMATRFDIEVCRHFYADLFRPRWLERGKELTRMLSLDTVRALSRIVDHVKTRSVDEDAALVSELVPRLRAMEGEFPVQRASSLLTSRWRSDAVVL